MKNKNSSLLILLSIMIVLMAGMVSAGTCIINTPAASATISGSYNFNITSTSSTTANCTITGTSTLSGGTWSLLAINSTANNVSNITASSTSIRDASDWSFSVSCANTSHVTDTCTRTGIKVDNYKPAISSCTIGGTSATTGMDVGSSDTTFVCTVKNATTCSAYWKTTTALAFASTAASRDDMSLNAITMSSSYGASGVTATANLKQVDAELKNVYFACSDGLNQTNTSTYTLLQEGRSPAQIASGISGTAQNAVASVATTSADNRDKSLYIILVSVIGFILIVALYFVVKKK